MHIINIYIFIYKKINTNLSCSLNKKSIEYIF